MQTLARQHNTMFMFCTLRWCATSQPLALFSSPDYYFHAVMIILMEVALHHVLVPKFKSMADSVLCVETHKDGL